MSDLKRDAVPASDSPSEQPLAKKAKLDVEQPFEQPGGLVPDPSTESDDGESDDGSDEDEQEVELMPMTRTGHRYLLGCELENSTLATSFCGIGVWENTIDHDAKNPESSKAILEGLKTQCRVLKTAAKTTEGFYSPGNTFWIGADEQPRCLLEQAALEIFEKHASGVVQGLNGGEQEEESESEEEIICSEVPPSGMTKAQAEKWVQEQENKARKELEEKKNQRALEKAEQKADEDAADPTVKPEKNDQKPSRSGAEFWAVAISEADQHVDLHFDKDYGLEADHAVNVHPLYGTILYLTDAKGAPTVITSKKEAYVRQDREEAYLEKEKISCVVSHPAVGKHICFDGQLLHFASSDLAMRAPAVAPPGHNHERIALLVNVWNNHRPVDCGKLSEKQIGALNSSVEQEMTVIAGLVEAAAATDDELQLLQLTNKTQMIGAVGGSSTAGDHVMVKKVPTVAAAVEKVFPELASDEKIFTEFTFATDGADAIQTGAVGTAEGMRRDGDRKIVAADPPEKEVDADVESSAEGGEQNPEEGEVDAEDVESSAEGGEQSTQEHLVKGRFLDYSVVFGKGTSSDLFAKAVAHLSTVRYDGLEYAGMYAGATDPGVIQQLKKEGKKLAVHRDLPTTEFKGRDD